MINDQDNAEFQKVFPTPKNRFKNLLVIGISWSVIVGIGTAILPSIRENWAAADKREAAIEGEREERYRVFDSPEDESKYWEDYRFAVETRRDEEKQSPYLAREYFLDRLSSLTSRYPYKTCKKVEPLSVETMTEDHKFVGDQLMFCDPKEQYHRN